MANKETLANQFIEPSSSSSSNIKGGASGSERSQKLFDFVTIARNPDVLQKQTETKPLWNLDIPSSEVIEGLVGKDRIETAAHEDGHAFTAIKLGEIPVYISLIPTEEYLGVTAFGNMSSNAFKIIAAAGSVDTHKGEAKGYGSDLQKIEILSYRHGGLTTKEARIIAQSIINEEPVAVRKRAAEILAYLGRNGDIPGYIVAEVHKRARWDVEQETKKRLNNPFAEVEKQIEKERQEYREGKQKEIRYKFINTLDGRKTIDLQAKKKDQKTYCPLCSGKNEHDPNCAAAIAGESVGEKMEEKEKFPQNDTIFPKN